MFFFDEKKLSGNDDNAIAQDKNLFAQNVNMIKLVQQLDEKAAE